MALIAVFVAVAFRSKHDAEKAGLTKAEPARYSFETVTPPAVDLTAQFEPITPPAGGLTPRFDVVTAPARDLTPRTEPVLPGPAAVPAEIRPHEEKEPLPLFVQALDRQIDEKRLLREVNGSNLARKAVEIEQLTLSQETDEDGNTTIVGTAERPRPAEAAPPKGGIEGLKDGFTSFIDSIENLFTGGKR